MDSGEIGRILRFSIIGASVAAVYIVAFTILSRQGISPYIANLIAFALAATFQYVGQTLWTFRGSLGDGIQGVRFVVTIGVGLLLSTVISSLLAPTFEWPPGLAATLVAVLLPFTNFVAFRFWVYRDTCTNEDRS